MKRRTDWFLSFIIPVFILSMVVILILSAYNIIKQTLFISAHERKLSAQYTVCFTPADQCEDLVVDEINSAHKIILVQAYHLTNHKIVAALLAKHQQNVPITVILDKVARKESIPFLNANIPVYIDGKVRIAHNKVMVIDDAAVITGSYNFTESAEHHNAENLLVIDNVALSQAYEDNFYDRLGVSSEVK